MVTLFDELGPEHPLSGSGVLEVSGEPVPLAEGDAVFVEARAAHRFSAYERLSVLVLFERGQ